MSDGPDWLSTLTQAADQSLENPLGCQEFGQLASAFPKLHPDQLEGRIRLVNQQCDSLVPESAGQASRGGYCQGFSGGIASPTMNTGNVHLGGGVGLVPGCCGPEIGFPDGSSNTGPSSSEMLEPSRITVDLAIGRLFRLLELNRK